MTIDYLKNIAEFCPKGEALLGLDVGKKTIGLALADPSHSIATPLLTIKRTKFTRDMIELSKVAKDYDVGGYVIGLPINMNGTEGRRAQSIKDFASEMERFLLTPSSHTNHPASSCGSTAGSLANQTDPSIKPKDDSSKVWIAFWDERLSTVSADNVVDNLVEKRKTKINSKSSGLIDKLAAQTILQGALDFMS